MSSLADLPARGYFTKAATVAPGILPVYVCDHDTSPPENQIIQTDPTNILIRALTLKKPKEESGRIGRGKGVAEDTKGKRVADKQYEQTGANKRPREGEAGSDLSPSYEQLQQLTVERLRTMLKEKGLGARGKKEELIIRLMQCH